MEMFGDGDEKKTLSCVDEMLGKADETTSSDDVEIEIGADVMIGATESVSATWNDKAGATGCADDGADMMIGANTSSSCGSDTTDGLMCFGVPMPRMPTKDSLR